MAQPSLIPDGQAVPYPPGTQYLQADISGRLARCGWAGPWPPPTEMLYLIGLTTSTWAELPTDEDAREAMRDWLRNGGAAYLLELETASQLDDYSILREDSRVMRGASYTNKGLWEVPE